MSEVEELGAGLVEFLELLQRTTSVLGRCWWRGCRTRWAVEQGGSGGLAFATFSSVGCWSSFGLLLDEQRCFEVELLRCDDALHALHRTHGADCGGRWWRHAFDRVWRRGLDAIDLVHGFCRRRWSWLCHALRWRWWNRLRDSRGRRRSDGHNCRRHDLLDARNRLLLHTLDAIDGVGFFLGIEHRSEHEHEKCEAPWTAAACCRFRKPALLARRLTRRLQ